MEAPYGFLLNVGARATVIFFLDNFFVIAFLGHSLTDLEKRKKKLGQNG